MITVKRKLQHFTSVTNISRYNYDMKYGCVTFKNQSTMDSGEAFKWAQSA